MRKFAGRPVFRFADYHARPLIRRGFHFQQQPNHSRLPIVTYWAPILTRGKLHLEVMDEDFPGETAPPMKSFSPQPLSNSKINFRYFSKNGRPLKSANLKFVKQFGVFEKYFSLRKRRRARSARRTAKMGTFSQKSNFL